MLQLKRLTILPAVVIFLLAFISACATIGPGKPPVPAAPPPEEIASSLGWWSARFRMDWPLEQTASWHIDLLIAHKIVAPVLEQYRESIPLWRFHRRAARDQAGHQFSFIYYASAETAYQVFETLRSNALLIEMKVEGMVLDDRYDNPVKITKPRIEDTSDPGWPSPIRKSWPYFIMGVSQMWLNLIADTAGDLPETSTPLSLKESEVVYKEVNAAITALWETDGRHAFLHHLNALFGYEPLIFYEKRSLKF